jgi:class 3 adenylate cyclase/TolB-like protein/lipoprotein NlpI
MTRDQRRLAAIVSADVAGYSRLMGEDESRTLAALKAHRSELIDPTIAEYGGRIVKTMGDGLLLDFPSVVDAVRCAVDVQRGMVERNAGVPADRRIVFRIGVNVGDIIIDGDDIYGDGVNVAARLQALAEPGEIFVSKVVRDQVFDKLSFAFEDLGPREVKNIARPIEVYRILDDSPAATARPQQVVRDGGTLRISRRVRWGGQWKRALLVTVAVVVSGAVAYVAVDTLWISKHAASADFAPPPHSIAVLPFVNMSPEKEQDYFSDGLSEELLNSLARINELQVAARTSSFYFKGEHADLATIAHKLNVASILEGSVRRSSQTVRVSARLTNAVTGYQLWSQTYDRDLGDVLKLQTEIANAVTNALKVTLLGDVAAKIEAGGTRNPAAFDAYLRASSAYRRFGPANLAAGGLNKEGLQSAIDAYTEAIRADPNYALAYAGRSLAFADFARALVSGPDVGGYFKQAQTDARKAIALAPDLADGHLALANFFAGSLEFSDALSEYERALALAPGNARITKEYGAFADLIGRTEAGQAAARRSLVLDPLNPVNHFGLGVSLAFSRRYSEAIRALTDARAFTPEDVSVNMWLGIAYYMSGDFQSARAACERAGEINGPWCLAMVYDKLGRRADAEAMLAKVRALAGGAFAEGYADIYAQWGDTARALDWLETAMRIRDPYLAYTKVNFFFDPLRNEPRFQAVMQKLKFPN